MGSIVKGCFANDVYNQPERQWGRSSCYNSKNHIEGGTQIIFDEVCGPRSEPYPYLILSLQNSWFDCFVEIFTNQDTYLRVSLPQKWLILQVFHNFCKMGPYKNVFKYFLTKMGPISKHFWWKSNPFGQHIPVCLNMWVLPSPNHIIRQQISNVCPYMWLCTPFRPNGWAIKFSELTLAKYLQWMSTNVDK